MTVKEQRINDFISSTSAILGDGPVLKVAQILFNNVKQNKNQFGYDFLAIPTIIMWVNSFEIFLNEIIFLLGHGFDAKITVTETERLSNLPPKKKFKEIRKIIYGNHTCPDNPEELDMIIQIRNDLVHHLPRNMYTDDVSIKLEKKNLLLSSNILAYKYESVKLVQFVRGTVIDLVEMLKKDIGSSIFINDSFKRTILGVADNYSRE